MTGGWFDPEAIESERFDADCEMAELEAAGRRESRARKAGLRCECGNHKAAADPACGSCSSKRASWEKDQKRGIPCVEMFPALAPAEQITMDLAERVKS